MASAYQEIENRIYLALEAYQRDKNRKLTALARDIANRPRLLTEAQKQAIVRTIDHLRRYNIKLNGKGIEDSANLLLWRQYERDHPEAAMPKSKSILSGGVETNGNEHSVRGQVFGPYGAPAV
ncbi:uncharacterized protein P174DRAFT_450534 [Aspergillus novofumigatus IBT 16806]|uniref:Uncharacterized protein n=1 Tax=Aspergillus novofumigatus (strain IBT 16806) TaxID=1392255 RepID=A0A2I1C7C3_ASPN1|nr:uncharacterized protein P174DRAFT_450534 [Aspergillus novofumigatus IBT 16806]PKX93524.1 hypothetical protein P174DRAFT_450534 [Aspergillus novofumigatus IBT 16806]